MNLVICIVAAFFARVETPEPLSEVEAIRVLTANGAQFERLEKKGEKPRAAIWFPYSKATAGNLRLLQYIDNLSVVHIRSSEGDGAINNGLEHLAQCKDLRSLKLDSMVTVDGLKKVRVLGSIRVLALSASDGPKSLS